MQIKLEGLQTSSYPVGHLGIFSFRVKFPSGREDTVLREGVHWLKKKSAIDKERGRAQTPNPRSNEDTWISTHVVKGTKNPWSQRQKPQVAGAEPI